MKTYEHNGGLYVQGEPIPVGHPALPKGTPYIYPLGLALDGGNFTFDMGCYFFAVEVPPAPDGYEILDFRCVGFGESFIEGFKHGVRQIVYSKDHGHADENIPTMGRKRFILKKKAERRCPGCGIEFSSGHDESAPTSCPWMIAYQSQDESGAKGEAYADAHWREHWTPKVGEWVTWNDERNNPFTFQVAGFFREDRIRSQTESKVGCRHWPKDYCRPAYPEEIAAAQKSAGVCPAESRSPNAHGAEAGKGHKADMDSVASNASPAQPLKSNSAPGAEAEQSARVPRMESGAGRNDSTPAPTAAQPLIPVDPAGFYRWMWGFPPAFEVGVNAATQPETVGGSPCTVWDVKGNIKRMDEQRQERIERAEYERLKKIFEGR